MKSKEKILNDLKNDGFSILEGYYDQEFCESAIKEINNIISKNQDVIYSKKIDGTSGDERIFKIENQSTYAKKFKLDSFINSIIIESSNRKISSSFILGGKLKFNKKSINNSGGGWHRDSDNYQFKSMLYLNDVNEKNGPFLFIPESDRFDFKRRKSIEKKGLLTRILILIGKVKKHPPRYSDEEVNLLLKQKNIKIKQILGKAGTVVLFNSSYIHRGKNIESGERFSLTNYFFKSNIISKYMRNRQFKHLYIPKK